MRTPRHVFVGALLVFAVGRLWGADSAGGVPNRLIHEKSPYLRQHAYNPVDWYPWGGDALEKARRENKLIFLSIGYSTCHWCHVMEQESFSDQETAAILNAHFVSIKVDREERPDLDRMYMAFVEKLTGNTGWPLNVWLTPDLKPFFGGSYFAPVSRSGKPGLKELLSRFSGEWKNRPERIAQNAEKVVASLAAEDAQDKISTPFATAALRDRAYVRSQRAFDAEHGGFIGAPKFPLTAWIEFWFDIQATTSEPKRREEALQMGLKTLREIAAGGIHDQIGGGFHRYSTDAQWRLPHFEKMLTDQAQLVNVLITGWQVSGDQHLRAAAVDTLDYVARDLTDPQGGFYSAEDADSAKSEGNEKSEGAFYLWTESEISHALTVPEREMFEYAFGILPGGNTPADPNENVVYRSHGDSDCVLKFHLSIDQVRDQLSAAMEKLRVARSVRPRPARDDKIIASGNGLMISAFARAAQAFGEPRYARLAVQAATFVRQTLVDPQTAQLSRSFRAGVRDPRGFSEDYAFLIQGLLDLYEATFDVQWLDWAVRLQEIQNVIFLDPAGGYFANAVDDQNVLLRLKERTDGSEPSSNSVTVRNLARLSALLHRDDWHALTERTSRTFGERLQRDPTEMPLMLVSADWLQGSPQQILIHGDADAAATQQLVAEVWGKYLPRHVLFRIDQTSRPFFAAKLPLVGDLPNEKASAPTAYVCENFACRLPTSDPAILGRQLLASSHRSAAK